jgi:hypothetical protein
MWHERLVEVRRPSDALDRRHLVETLVRTWSPGVAHGDLSEL